MDLYFECNFLKFKISNNYYFIFFKWSTCRTTPLLKSLQIFFPIPLENVIIFLIKNALFIFPLLSFIGRPFQLKKTYVPLLITGACGVFVAHPLDTIKTWQQASNTSVPTAIQQIYKRNNGVRHPAFFHFSIMELIDFFSSPRSMAFTAECFFHLLQLAASIPFCLESMAIICAS